MESTPGENTTSAEDKRLIASTKAAMEGEDMWFTVASNSMYPYLRTGDEVKLTRLADLPRWGTVVAYVLNDRIQIHRFRGSVSADTVRIWGDMLKQPDEPVALERLVGRLRAVRRAGREFSWLQKCLASAYSFLRGCLRRRMP